MRKILFSISLLVLTVMISAQNPLAKGSSQLNAGIGFSNWGLPLYIGFDHGIHKDISIGAEFNYHSYHERYNTVNYNFSILGISGNCNYHFNSVLNIPNNWDFYAGLNLGFYFWSSPNGYGGSHSSGLGLGAQVGGRYFFTNKFGLNLELGGGTGSTGGKFGITYKF